MDEFKIAIDEEVKPKAKVDRGVPWEELKFKLNAREFAKLLRNNGILNYQDARTKCTIVVRLLQQSYKVDLGTILAFARKYEEVE